ncbi:MAG: hypothetical protein ACLQIB_46635 [Isosphaeraceae bacterium]
MKITGEVAYGYDVILLGELSITTAEDKAESLPIACHIRFNPKGKIEKPVGGRRGYSATAASLPEVNEVIPPFVNSGSTGLVLCQRCDFGF